MTPKDTAFRFLFLFKIDDKKTAKKCALIVVNEIIKAHPTFPMPWHIGVEINGLVDNAMFPYNYWEEVKKEIEKL